MVTAVTEHAWLALHEPLLAFFRKRVRDEATAEDLLQEVFLRIHTRAETVREEEKLESWIYQIAHHRLIDYYRSQKPLVPLEAVEEDVFLEEMPEEDVQSELAPSVAAFVQVLPEPYREALILTEYQGLSQRELATRPGLSFSGAKSRVQRAREKLKQLLLECCHFEFDRLGRIIEYHPHCACCSAGACSPMGAEGTADSESCVLLETPASTQRKTCCTA